MCDSAPKGIFPTLQEHTLKITVGKISYEIKNTRTFLFCRFVSHTTIPQNPRQGKLLEVNFWMMHLNKSKLVNKRKVSLYIYMLIKQLCFGSRLINCDNMGA